MDKRIYLCLAHMSGKEQNFIKEAFDTNWVVPLGPNVNGFEEDLKQFVGGRNEVVVLSAGTGGGPFALDRLRCDPRGRSDCAVVYVLRFLASDRLLRC